MSSGLSAALISWNEALTIDLCLRSLAGFADEVVIADTGSFDGTMKKAVETIDELGISATIARIKAHSLGEARKAAVKLGTRDWVLLSDANMVYGENVKAEFRGVMKSGQPGLMMSLNLIGDYEHAFAPREMNALHITLFRRDAPNVMWGASEDRPMVSKPTRRMRNWAVNLSRVRPAWRCWYRGEPFAEGGDKWKTPTNRQYHWLRRASYPSLVDYVKQMEGLSLDDVRRIAPKWYLKLLQEHAKPISEEQRKLLPEVIKEELKNPRYKLTYGYRFDYNGAKIVGRNPEL